MKNKVTVSIAGQDYTMVSADNEHYVRKVAAYVDGQIREVLESGRLSLANGAVLTAMNIADQYYREASASENLRRQVKESLEENAKLKAELSECKREIFKLQNKKG